jgi:hypothetical protein
MWTRREVLLAGGLLGAATAAPLAARLPPAPGHGGPLRVALLQGAAPFVDAADLRGSRERAFAALAVLLERSADAAPRLDWLVAGAWPLAAAAPLPAAASRAFALDPGSAEIAALRDFAKRRELRLTLAAWWRDRAMRIEPRLLAFGRDGALSAQPLPATVATEPRETFAAACARLGLAGACIEPACDPATAPQVTAPRGGGTRLLGADGRTVAAATTQAETCVVGELPA